MFFFFFVRIYVKFRAGKLFWDPSIAPLAADLQVLEGKRSLRSNYTSLGLVKMLGKVNKSPRWWWKLVIFTIILRSTMVQSVKKKHLKRIQAKVLIVETKATPNICWSEICIKHTHSNCKHVPSERNLAKISEIDFMEDVSLVQMLKKKSHHCPPSTTWDSNLYHNLTSIFSEAFNL